MTLPGLTPRQSEVVRLVSRGLYDKNIALRLGITERTVKLHQAGAAAAWNLDPLLSRRAQIIRRVVELEDEERRTSILPCPNGQTGPNESTYEIVQHAPAAA